MRAFDLEELVARRQEQSDLYLEFLRVPDFSLGVYLLPAGGHDPQQPHAEDEVYFIAAGKGMIDVDGENRDADAGSIVYVPAGVPHHFHTIEEDLVVLVLFAPAESTPA